MKKNIGYLVGSTRRRVSLLVVLGLAGTFGVTANAPSVSAVGEVVVGVG